MRYPNAPAVKRESEEGWAAPFAQHFRSAQRMPLALPLRCRCGHLRGVASDVSPSTGFRFVCYCKDCQAFARFLERADVLDPAGGTDIFQMPPGRVKLTAGTDALRCLRLSNKVFRWYTDCCRTPIGNTAAGPRFPVVAVVHSFMDHEADGRSRDEVLGPPLCRIYERSAVGPLPPNAPRRRRSGSSPAARQKYSAGGCAGSAGRRRSSMIGRRLRARCRACSRRASAPLFDPLCRESCSPATADQAALGTGGGNACALLCRRHEGPPSHIAHR